MANFELEKLGVCPVCKKGHIVRGSIGYSCNYFKSFEDKCTFTIYSSYFGKEITSDIAKELIENGKTRVFNDFKTQEEKPFSASLIIEDNIVKPNFKKETLETPCPICDGKIEIGQKSYMCENYHPQEEDACKLYIPRVICEKEIAKNIAELLVKGEKTPFISGFKNKLGEDFTTRLYLNDDLRIEFKNDLCECPKCGGDVLVNQKAYSCSNYKNEDIKCDFVIWREMSGRKITQSEAIQLCEKGETNILNFKSKDGNTYERKLILTDDFKVKMI